MPGQGFRWSWEQFGHEEKPRWGSWGGCYWKRKLSTKNTDLDWCRLELTRAWGVGRTLGLLDGKATSTEATPMHPQLVPASEHPCPVQLAADKLFHGHKNGAGVGEIHQSVNVDNCYKQSVDRTRLVYRAGVSLIPGCNLRSQQNLNRKWQGQRPEEERISTEPSCIKQM